jgi:hypothetical protein
MKLIKEERSRQNIRLNKNRSSRELLRRIVPAENWSF